MSACIPVQIFKSLEFIKYGSELCYDFELINSSFKTCAACTYFIIFAGTNYI